MPQIETEVLGGEGASLALEARVRPPHGFNNIIAIACSLAAAAPIKPLGKIAIIANTRLPGY